jgi:hypothetical protein
VGGETGTECGEPRPLVLLSIFRKPPFQREEHRWAAHVSMVS